VSKLVDRPASPFAASTLFLGVVALALCVGLAEAATIWSRRMLTGKLVWVGPQIFWMAPAGYFLLALAPAAFLALVARLRPRLSAAALSVGVGGLLAIGCVSLLRIAGQQRLYLPATILVGLGFAVQVPRALLRSSHRLRGWASALLLGALATIGTIGLGVEASRIVRAKGLRKRSAPEGRYAQRSADHPRHGPGS
jgi:hypothetical protein